MDLQTITIVDKSEYMDAFPESPMLEVLPPGHTKWVNLPFKPRDINTITTGQLNLTCGEITTLPDGVYRFTLSVCPNDSVFLCKANLRTTLIEYMMQNFILKVVDSCDEDAKIIKKKLIDIDCLLSAGKANARKGNIMKAAKLYNKANDILNSINKNCK